jgi:carboxy-cis,cis-muconate cyclase
MKKWSSYSVKSPTEIVHEAAHPMLHDGRFKTSPQALRN